MTAENPFFHEILNSTPPPNWRKQVDSEFSGVFTVDSLTGIMQPASLEDLDEYVEGGEYDSICDEDEGWQLQI